MALLVEPELLRRGRADHRAGRHGGGADRGAVRGLRRTLAGSMLFISHHLGLVAQLCDAICVLYGGTVVESRPVAAGDPAAGTPTRGRCWPARSTRTPPARSAPSRATCPTRQPPSPAASSPRAARRRARVPGADAALAQKAPGIARPASWCPMPEPLRSRDVRVRFGAVEALAGVSLAVRRARSVGLVGESGSGKTTLCRALLGLQPVRAGRVVLEGRNLAAWPDAGVAPPGADAAAGRRRVPVAAHDGCARCWRSRSASTGSRTPSGGRRWSGCCTSSACRPTRWTSTRTRSAAARRAGWRWRAR